MIIHNITKKQYRENPCGVCPFAFWKNESFKTPDNIQVIHESKFTPPKNGVYEVSRYFRLLHNLKTVDTPLLSDGYCFKNVDVLCQNELVASVINRCYEDIEISTEQVAQWTKSKVFDNGLWIFVYEKASALPVALGIADFDSSIKEGSLEWLQVLPQKRGQGLGAAIINELLSRLKAKADFVTVSGKIDNQTNPEALYRKCGFEGDDIWCVLSFKSEG